MSNQKKTYVLVHGAWHGAWSWNKTRQKLIEVEHEVITFDLPGHGKDKTPVSEITFDGYVNKVKQELFKTNNPVILVGHSLAGFVISKVAEDMPGKIEKLVFVAAMIPHQDKSVFEILQGDNGSELLPNLIFAEDQSWATVNEETLKNVVYNGASAEQIAEAAPNLVKQATQPFFVKVDTTQNNFGNIAKTYIECSVDKILSLNAQRSIQQAVDCGQILSLNNGHVPQIESPVKLAEALLEI